MADTAPPESPPAERLGLTEPGRRSLSLVSSLVHGAGVAGGVLVVTFLLIRLTPGDPATALCELCSAEDVDRLREDLGLTGSLPRQFWSYLSGVARGDLGTSLRSGQSVAGIIAQRLVPSALLVSMTLIFSLVFAVAIVSALGALGGPRWERAFSLVTSALLALPVFFSGVVAILLVAIRWGLAPVGGFESGFPSSVHHLWLPALVTSFTVWPIVARLLYASVSRTMTEEFVEAASTRRLRGRVFWWSYVLRPSLAPSIALLGYVCASLLGAAVLVELVFNVPGLGYTLIEAINNRDYPTVQGLVLLSGLAVVVINGVVEVLAARIDPRQSA